MESHAFTLTTGELPERLFLKAPAFSLKLPNPPAAPEIVGNVILSVFPVALPEKEFSSSNPNSAPSSNIGGKRSPSSTTVLAGALSGTPLTLSTAKSAPKGSEFSSLP
ncbi:hypothetical protein, partial [Akkermansia sp. BIOML-A17]|uniref:hypothetical protein n=1 Tax=Akkermansia sp. BIOML-A17 TaxID=2584573 RepID=UPI00195A61BA